MIAESNAIKHNELLKKIQNLAASYGDRLIFEALLDAIIRWFLLKDESGLDLLDNVEKIKDEDKKAFTNLFQAFFKAQQEATEAQGYADVVGVLWQELNLANSRLGQFYTPWTVVIAMSQMIFNVKDIQKVNSEKRPYLYLDPAYGSGRFSVGFNSIVVAHYEKTKEVLEVDYTNIDIDLLAVKMTTVNMLLHNMKGRVYWGNALGDTYRAAFHLIPYNMVKAVGISGEGKFPFDKQTKAQIAEWVKQNKPKNQISNQLKLW